MFVLIQLRNIKKKPLQILIKIKLHYWTMSYNNQVKLTTCIDIRELQGHRNCLYHMYRHCDPLEIIQKSFSANGCFIPQKKIFEESRGLHMAKILV